MSPTPERNRVTSTRCAHCGSTTNTDGLMLCPHCQGTAKVGAENVATYHADLFSLGGNSVRIRTRRGGVADPTGGAVAYEGAENDPADLAAADTHAQLAGWARILVNDRPQLALPRDTVAAISAFLVHNTGSIATLDWAETYLGELLALERRLRGIVERGRGRWYAGVCSAILREEMPHDGMTCACACHQGPGYPCDIPGGCGLEFGSIEAEICEQDLYAVPGTSYVRCPSCKTHHPVAQRRAILLAEARETLLPISVIASAAVTLLGSEPSVERLKKRIQKWAERGQIRSYGEKVVDGQPRRVYALGEVLDMLTSEAAGQPA